MKHKADQFDLPGQEGAFNLAGQTQTTPEPARKPALDDWERQTILPLVADALDRTQDSIRDAKGGDK